MTSENRGARYYVIKEFGSHLCDCSFKNYEEEMKEQVHTVIDVFSFHTLSAIREKFRVGARQLRKEIADPFQTETQVKSKTSTLQLFVTIYSGTTLRFLLEELVNDGYLKKQFSYRTSEGQIWLEKRKL